ncbi:MAG: ABC transporter ATP-binding protein [Planctomycetes bacterium]|nr:ABC transporter ATP-binding protein [Planctomycetota bacterium]
MVAPGPLIDLVDVHKTLGTKHILQGMTLQVNRGETLVIIGRSGIGKTVTLKHMVGLLRPDRGKVLIEGRDISSYAQEDLDRVRMKFGFVWQNGALLNSMSVGANVALPLREHENLPDDEIRRIVREKLAIVDLHDVEDMMPGILSGGMKKRVSLARAIVRSPEFILYDEPTAGLDPIMSNAINELIVNMKTTLGVTSVVVTHDMPSAFRIADRIAMLRKGRIIKIGTPAEFLETDDPVIKQFVYGEEEGPDEATEV